mmetsp:Transcript_17566/g.38180  ORF Transcript_17566/g.38180 Transcript_17566/m.38180 type:complete len:95 (+) Transcript_17566:119-403(+)
MMLLLSFDVEIAGDGGTGTKALAVQLMSSTSTATTAEALIESPMLSVCSTRVRSYKRTIRVRDTPMNRPNGAVYQSNQFGIPLRSAHPVGSLLY